MRSSWLPCAVLFLPLVAACASAPPGPARFALGPCPETAPAADGSAVINGFYQGFARRDFLAMACSYAPDIEFTDSIFGTLKGKRAFAMWAMLTSQGGTLEIQHSAVQADATTGKAHWDAQYDFPFLAFSNHVDNHIEAVFVLRDGKIIRHKDSFDLQRWMHLALWPLGGVVSEDTIKEGVQKKLDEFVAAHVEFQDNPAPPPH